MNLSNRLTASTSLAITLAVVLPAAASMKSAGVPISITALVPGLWLLIALLSNISALKIRLVPVDIAMVALFSVLAIMSLFNARQIVGLPIGYGIQILSLLLVCPLGYWVGRVVGSAMDSATADWLLYANIIIVLIFVMVMGFSPTFSVATIDEAGSYYQFMGDSLAVIALCTLGVRYHHGLLGPYFMTGVLLVGVGSRASAIAFFLSLLLSNRVLFTAGIAAISGLILITAGLLASAELPEWMNDFRVVTTAFALLRDGTIDLSYLERLEYFFNGLDIIISEPMFGLIGYEYQWGLTGSYIHSGLHIWATFGIVAFALFVIAVIMPLFAYQERLSWESDRANTSATTSRALVIFSIIQFALFRHPDNFVLFFALGFATSIQLKVSTFANRSQKNKIEDN